MPELSTCQSARTDSKIKLREGKRKIVFLNDKRTIHIITQVDGCVIKNEIAADFVISVEALGSIVVELKGKNVDHAVKQVMATAKYWSDNGLIRNRFGSIIVCAQYPRQSTSVQKAQNDFSKKYKGPLKVICGTIEIEIEKALSFQNHEAVERR